MGWEHSREGKGLFREWGRLPLIFRISLINQHHLFQPQKYHCELRLSRLNYIDTFFLFLATSWPWMWRITLRTIPSAYSPWNQRWKCKLSQSYRKQLVVQMCAWVLVNKLGAACQYRIIRCFISHMCATGSARAYAATKVPLTHINHYWPW